MVKDFSEVFQDYVFPIFKLSQYTEQKNPMEISDNENSERNEKI